MENRVLLTNLTQIYKFKSKMSIKNCIVISILKTTPIIRF